jgi:hypothetical protein
MLDQDVVSVRGRPETPKEAALAEWFAKQEIGAMDNLESAAQQIIQLVTAFYTVIFGILALGADSFETSLASPLVAGLGMMAILALLFALVAALIVLAPFPARFRRAVSSDHESTFANILRGKAFGLLIAFAAFGTGLAAFAILIITMLALR